MFWVLPGTTSRIERKGNTIKTSNLQLQMKDGNQQREIFPQVSAIALG